VTNITIKQACEADIPVIENILLDTVKWLNEMNRPLWRAEDMVWDILAKEYRIEEFYIAYLDGIPSGCVALIDYDPFFWPDIKKGDALFFHKLAVTKAAKGSGAADAMMNYIKALCTQKQISSIRLDCHQHRPKLREFYERHGFVCIGEKRIAEKFDVAFYIWEVGFAGNDKVDYWLSLAEYDMDTARGMLKIRKYLYVGFMCHQTIEKALKAVIACDCGKDEIPPKIHHLLKLAKKANLLSEMSETQKGVIRKLNPLNIEARYPEYKEHVAAFLNNDNSKTIIAETEDLLCWIKERLTMR
jgi:HEPN domain-containing protein/N-acetylglutamate synthase-like GNAT family acetyltransferase